MTEYHAATLGFIRKMEGSCKFFFLMIIKMDRLFHEKNLGAWPRLENWNTQTMKPWAWGRWRKDLLSTIIEMNGFKNQFATTPPYHCSFSGQNWEPKKLTASFGGINPGCWFGYSAKVPDFDRGLSPPVPPYSHHNDLLKKVCVLLLPGRAP